MHENEAGFICTRCVAVASAPLQGRELELAAIETNKSVGQTSCIGEWKQLSHQVRRNSRFWEVVMSNDSNNQRSVIIIGVGIAGLAAGCYAQMHGFESKIFEMHDIPGGIVHILESKGVSVWWLYSLPFWNGQGRTI